MSFVQELETTIKLTREAGAIIRTFYQVPPTVRWKDPTEPDRGRSRGQRLPGQPNQAGFSR